MKPIPAPSAAEESPPPHDATPASAAELLKSPAGRPSHSNRRSLQSSVQQAYPWLLALSTAVAVLFALLYINKDYVVIQDGVAETQADSTQPDSSTGPVAKGGSKVSLLPDRRSLPGEKPGATEKPETAIPNQIEGTAPLHARYEETNMRVQHILNATTEGGHVSRIDLEVPVLYQSRQLRWTPAEVDRAREILVQLMDYQDKSRQLRSQGEGLLHAWNELVGRSIPASRLRADSPSLPQNQNDVTAVGGALDTTTRDAIEIQPKEQP